ncbi:TIGR03943 family protein [Kovacikia minuta CCNUW1]|uniref:TIGR03943 family putative permease subunit n=1 Tax=Kovacikia minuta TaxID=2931930 RepID=UPI001CCD32C4|nr:TIGR03943 family protein [Kovacikia minuta]UBF25476.1 TIGR03943 family protein [Kovacikia minuta CCNUW1]
MSSRVPRTLFSWLDVLAIAAWGILFLKYWVTGKLFLLIHPNYIWLTIIAGFVLLVLAGIRAVTLFRRARRGERIGGSATQHLTLFPPGWSSALLLATAILGLLISPRAFASQTAIDRGVNDTLTMTRVKPQAFRGIQESEDKSIVDWIRTLTVYPEPDAYTGQKAKVQGFVTYPPNLPDQYLLISRFVITCCAADVYPVSLPVKLSQSRKAYKPDTWLEIEGQMITETLSEKRQLVIAATGIKEISEPKNPYDY